MVRTSSLSVEMGIWFCKHSFFVRITMVAKLEGMVLNFIDSANEKVSNILCIFCLST